MIFTSMPGPTFRIQQNTETVVRYVNHADRATSVHLHGSESRAPFDGYADGMLTVQLAFPENPA